MTIQTFNNWETYSDIRSKINSNFTDLESDVTANTTKLAGIETGATADQTAGEIKTAYESNADTNAYTDDEKTKLTGIEAGATADQTDAEIATAYWNEIAQVSGAEITAGTETALRTYSPADVKNFVDTHGGWGGWVESFFDAWNSGTAKTIDWDNSINQTVTLTGNCTFTLSNPVNWETYILKLVQDGTGGRTVTLPASVKTQYGALNTSTGANDIDVLSLVYDGTNYYANLGKNYE